MVEYGDTIWIVRRGILRVIVWRESFHGQLMGGQGPARFLSIFCLLSEIPAR